ncbi:MAG: hypothetical protein RL754_912 [Bacteroidota bacterium]|jgi:hypothetical protein
MKKIAILTAAALLALGSCKPEVGPIGPAYEAGAGLIGTWELTGVDQTDLTLPVPETRDISDFYQESANKWVVQFNADSTYSVNEQGPGFDLFGAGGTWRYNTPEFPSELQLTQDTVTTVLALGNMPRTIDVNLGIVYSRERCEKPSVQYNLTFTRK